MNDWFIWKNKRCTRYGIHVSEQPPLTVPAERCKQIVIPGRSGSLTLTEGDDVYDDMVLTAQCFIPNPSRIQEIAAWLRGSSKVTFANRQNGFYFARIANQIAFEKILRGNPHRSFAVSFRCQPFWYLSDVEDITVTESGSDFSNPGTVFSEPTIRVDGSGIVDLLVNDQLVELDIGSSDSHITMNTKLQEAFCGSNSRNSRMSGEFPVLKTGRNTVSWSGNVSQVIITPNWRCL